MYPSIVFIPGAWHPAEMWDLVIPKFSLSHEVITLSLPTIGGTGNLTLQDDAKPAQQTYTRLADSGKDIIVVAHSYGAMVASQSLEGFLKKDRVLNGKIGGIVGILWIAGVLQPIGGSVKAALAPDDATWDSALSNFTYNKEDNTVTLHQRSLAAERYYSDCDEDVVDWIFKLLKPQTLSAWLSKITYVPYGAIPQKYVYCSADKNVTPEVQERFIQYSGGRTATKVVELKASHSPMLSMPEAVARIIEQFVQEVADENQTLSNVSAM